MKLCPCRGAGGPAHPEARGRAAAAAASALCTVEGLEHLEHLEHLECRLQRLSADVCP
jgi:hypothetical protein